MQAQESNAEPSCFPVTQEIVDRALAEIAADPNQAINNEGSYIQNNSPGLERIVWQWVDVALDPEGTGKRGYEFIEGASWSHLILRRQAEERGLVVPHIREELSGAFLRSEQDLLQSEHQGEFQPREEFTRRGSLMAEEEPELGRAIEDIARYRIEGPDIWGGAATAYFAIKHTERAGSLNEMFAIKEELPSD